MKIYTRLIDPPNDILAEQAIASSSSMRRNDLGILMVPPQKPPGFNPAACKLKRVAMRRSYRPGSPWLVIVIVMPSAVIVVISMEMSVTSIAIILALMVSIFLVATRRVCCTTDTEYR